MSTTENWVRVASLDDVEVGTVIGVEVAGRKLAVYHLEDGDVCVTDNVCTHAFALLSEGWLEDGVIECPLHGGQFDVRTGEGLAAPIEKDLEVFPTRVEGSDIMVQLP